MRTIILTTEQYWVEEQKLIEHLCNYGVHILNYIDQVIGSFFSETFFC